MLVPKFAFVVINRHYAFDWRCAIFMKSLYVLGDEFDVKDET